MGTNVYIVLEILAFINPAGWHLPLGSWVLNENVMARFYFGRKHTELRPFCMKLKAEGEMTFRRLKEEREVLPEHLTHLPSRRNLPED